MQWLLISRSDDGLMAESPSAELEPVSTATQGSGTEPQRRSRKTTPRFDPWTLCVNHQAERAIKRKRCKLGTSSRSGRRGRYSRMVAHADLGDDVAAVSKHLIHQRRRQLDVLKSKNTRDGPDSRLRDRQLPCRVRGSHARAGQDDAESRSASPVVRRRNRCARRQGDRCRSSRKIRDRRRRDRGQW